MKYGRSSIPERGEMVLDGGDDGNDAAGGDG